MKPDLSVIIPSYNYAGFLPYTLENVLAEQGVTLEVIVVDDGSTDGTAEVAAPFVGSGNLGNSGSSALRYIRQENQGLPAARNTGLRAAQGDFLVFLDADDLFYPGTLRSQLETLSGNPGADLAVCRNLLFKAPEVSGGLEIINEIPLVRDNFELNLCRQNIAPVHAFMLRKGVPEKAGLFDTSLRALEDYDFWLRCAAAGCGFAVNTRGTALYRRHVRSISFDESGLRLHGCELRVRVAELLRGKPDFLAAHRPDAWLAHAAACLELASGLHAEQPEKAFEMLVLGEDAVKRAAKEIAVNRKRWMRTKSTDALLALSAMRAAGYAAELFLKGRGRMERVLEIIERSLPEYNYPPAERPQRVAALNQLLSFPPEKLDLSVFGNV